MYGNMAYWVKDLTWERSFGIPKLSPLSRSNKLPEKGRLKKRNNFLPSPLAFSVLSFKCAFPSLLFAVGLKTWPLSRIHTWKVTPLLISYSTQLVLLPIVCLKFEAYYHPWQHPPNYHRFYQYDLGRFDGIFSSYFVSTWNPGVTQWLWWWWRR